MNDIYLIDEVELKNVGPYVDRRFIFSSGLTAIVGPNGSGKSTLLRSIFSALTGNFSRFGGRSFARNSAASPDEVAGVKVVLKNPFTDEKIVVVRSVSDSKHKLTHFRDPDEKPVRIKSSKEVVKYLSEVLGVSPEFLSILSFVDQWSVFSFLDSTAVGIYKEFAGIFNMDKFSQIRNVCDQFIDNNVVLEIQKVKSWLENAKKQLDNFESIKKTLLNELSNVEKKLILIKSFGDGDLEKAKDVIYSFVKLHNRISSGNLVELRDRCRVTWREHRSKEGEASFLYEQISRNEEIVNRVKELMQKKEALLSDQARIKWELNSLKSKKADLEAKLSDFSRQIEEAKKELSELREVSDDEISEAKERIDEYDRQLVLLRARLNFARSGRKFCPECGSLFTNAQVDPEFWESKTNKVLALRDEAAAALAKLQYSNDRRAFLNDLIASSEHELNQVKQDLGQINQEIFIYENKFSALSKELSEVDQEFSNYSEILKQTDSLMIKYGDVCSERDRLKADFENFLKEYLGYLRDYRKFLANKEKVLLAVEVSRELESLLVKERSLLDRLGDLEKAIGDFRVLVDEHNAKLSELYGSLKRSDFCSKVKSVFMSDRLIGNVLRRFFGAIRDEANRLLNDVDSDLMIDGFDSVHGFLVRNRDRVLHFRLLSGGEKVVVALAVRFGLYRALNTRLPVLCLDEPFAGLDERNIQLVGRFLEVLSAHLSGDWQCMVVTHERQTINWADRVLELHGEAVESQVT